MIGYLEVLLLRDFHDLDQPTRVPEVDPIITVNIRAPSIHRSAERGFLPSRGSPPSVQGTMTKVGGHPRMKFSPVNRNRVYRGSSLRKHLPSTEH